MTLVCFRSYQGSVLFCITYAYTHIEPDLAQNWLRSLFPLSSRLALGGQSRHVVVLMNKKFNGMRGRSY